MIRLHHADHLEPLLDALADVLAVVPSDPFTPDLVVVPSAGVADAAMAGLGRRLGATGAGDGICANVEMIFPGRFLARALGDTAGPDEPDSDPWRLPRLTWAVLEVLSAGSVDVPRPAGTDVDQWALARRIADLFDRYASQRPSLVAAWARGVDTDATYTADGDLAPLDASHRWQPTLWRAVRARLDTPSPPERLPGLLDALASGALQPDLPPRLSVFGVGSLAPTMLSVLEALSQTREVHVFLRHPSQQAWDDSPHRLAGGLNVRSQLEVATHTAHPLLASWGRPSLEARALLNGRADVIEVAHGRDRSIDGSTLLGALQHGIRTDEAPAPIEGLDPADATFQVHACHGHVRQLEVLRDALGHAFVADPTLAPHDVFVLCPDLETFAPLIDAVFARGSLPVPVRIGDRSLTTTDPLTGALASVLTLVSGRATLSEVLALVQFEPVRRRFGWTIDHVEQLADWCSTLGTRWGLSADDRAAWGLPDTLTTGTWRTTVDQLLAGAAISAPSARVVLGDVAPYDDIATGDLDLVGSVADLLARLVALHAQIATPRPIADWVDLLHTVVDDFCDVEPAESWRRQAVHRTLDAIVQGAATPGTTPSDDDVCPVSLTFTDVQAVLADTLQDRPGRLALRSGAVTISSLIPQHGVPARVICLLGLDDSGLRSSTFDGDDILGIHPCLGERHPRHETRQLLLDAVLDARQRLIITCDGADLTTNKETPFAVPLVELLDVVERLAPGATTAGHGVVVRHPRHGFNERALVPGALWTGSSGPFTFDTTMRDAAEVRRRALAAPPVAESSPWALPPVPLSTVDMAMLTDVVANPSRIYLRERLEVRLPEEADAVDDGLAVSIDPLTSSALGRSLLDSRRTGASPYDWEEGARLDGSLPPGALSTVALHTVMDEVALLESLADEWAVPLAGHTDEPIAQTLSVEIDGAPTDLVLQGVVHGAVVTAGRSRLVTVRYTRPRPSFRLTAAVQLAAVQRQHPDDDWSAVLVHRGTGASPTASGLRLRGATSAERVASAERLLALAVQLLAWSLRDAVPVFDRTSSSLAAGSLANASSSIDEDLRDAHVATLWPTLSLDDLLNAPVVPGDPTAVVDASTGDGAALSRAVAAAEWVWGTVHDTVEDIGTDGRPVESAAGDDA